MSYCNGKKNSNFMMAKAVEITQSTGDSISAVMSQKAVTDHIDKMNKHMDDLRHMVVDGNVETYKDFIWEFGTLNGTTGEIADDTRNRLIRSSEYLPSNITVKYPGTTYTTFIYMYNDTDDYVQRVQLASDIYLDGTYRCKLLIKYGDNRTLDDADVKTMLSDITLVDYKQPNTLCGLDTVNSWWCNPRCEYNAMRDNLYVTGVSSGGLGRINIFNLRYNTVRTVNLSYMSKDDHNTPCLLLSDDEVPIVAYTSHSKHQYVRIRRGKAPYDVESLETATEKQVSFANDEGDECTYASLIPFKNGKLVLITRLGSDLHYSVSEDWGNTWSEHKLFIGGLYYGTFRYSQTGDYINYVVTTHPFSHGVSDIHYIRIALETGEIKDFNGVIGKLFDSRFTGIMIRDKTYNNLVYSTNNDNNNDGSNSDDKDKSIRVLDVRMDGSILCCELNRNAPEEGGMYFVLIKGSGYEWSRRDIISSGALVGYNAGGYVAGACFDSDKGMYVCRESKGIWYTEHYVYNATITKYICDKRIDTDTLKMGRPTVAFINGGTALTYLKYAHYSENSYNDFYGDQITVKVNV